MSFTDLIFFPFLILTYLVFYSFRKYPRILIAVLVVSSYCFYGWWNYKYLPLLLYITFLNFFAGYFIDRSSSRSVRKALLVLTLCANLAPLAYFKYTDFLIESAVSISHLVGADFKWAPLNILLPIGISFFTFHTLSYPLSIYSGQFKPVRSPLNFMLFVAAFPQLVAGPIIRAADFLPQLAKNIAEKANAGGIFFILYGLVKKLLIADMLGLYLVDGVFANPQNFNSLKIVMAVYAYAFQIFFDFSAYSDIAIGLGMIFGLTYPVNFRSPYLALGPSDFWRRWHISLSTWFRDYLYIPLGGNRGSQLLQSRNLLITMLLVGLWHGAKWNFVIWGGIHGLYLVLFRHLPLKIRTAYEGLPSVLRAFFFFNLACFAWIFFRAVDLETALTIMKGIWAWRGLNMEGLYSLAPVGLSLFAAAVLVHNYVEPRLTAWSKRFSGWHWAFQASAAYSLFVILYLLGELEVSQKAFIYFQF